MYHKSKYRSFTPVPYKLLTSPVASLEKQQPIICLLKMDPVESFDALLLEIREVQVLKNPFFVVCCGILFIFCRVYPLITSSSLDSPLPLPNPSAAFLLSSDFTDSCRIISYSNDATGDVSNLQGTDERAVQYLDHDILRYCSFWVVLYRNAVIHVYRCYTTVLWFSCILIVFIILT